jgi:hypothetical protein
MRKKSYKIKKLEKNRFSILTDNLDSCYICHCKKDHLHEIYEGKNRLNSMRYGFVIPVCFNCHRYITDHPSEDLKKECQKKFEETNSRETFISIIRRNYL